jgi:hypothetical protein
MGAGLAQTVRIAWLLSATLRVAVAELDFASWVEFDA